MVELRLTKIEKPKPQYRLTPEIIKLIQEVHPLQKKIYFEFNKRYTKTPWVDPEKIMKAFYDESPDLFKQVDSLYEALEEKEFEAVYNEELASVALKALKGDRNSWLKLLRWNITYLEDKQLRKIIYEESTKSNSDFLKEIVRIVSNPERFHANLKRGNYTQFILRYNPNESIEKNLNMLTDYYEENEATIPDRRQIMRIVKKSKKK